MNTKATKPAAKPAAAERVKPGGLGSRLRAWREQHLYSLVSSLGRLLKRPFVTPLRHDPGMIDRADDLLGPPGSPAYDDPSDTEATDRRRTCPHHAYSSFGPAKRLRSASL